MLTARTKAIIPVHLGGWPCEMDEIFAAAKERALSVVEDCAQNVGARYAVRTTGSMGDIGAFSFCQHMRDKRTALAKVMRAAIAWGTAERRFANSITEVNNEPFPMEAFFGST